MKKVLFTVCFLMVASVAFSQTWSFQDGYDAGKSYRDMDRIDMFLNSYYAAQQGGQVNYALGMREGWETNAPLPTGGQPPYITIDWDFIGPNCDPWLQQK